MKFTDPWLRKWSNRLERRARHLNSAGIQHGPMPRQHMNTSMRQWCQLRDAMAVSRLFRGTTVICAPEESDALDQEYEQDWAPSSLANFEDKLEVLEHVLRQRVRCEARLMRAVALRCSADRGREAGAEARSHISGGADDPNDHACPPWLANSVCIVAQGGAR